LTSGDPTEKNSKLQELAMKIRTRKGLKPDVPAYDVYYDKL
jgi:elongation factor 2